MWYNNPNPYPSGAPEFTFPGLSGFRVARSLVLYVCFVDRWLSFCPYSFGHCVVCPSIYGFWLHLWYLQTLIKRVLLEEQVLLILSEHLRSLPKLSGVHVAHSFVFCVVFCMSCLSFFVIVFSVTWFTSSDYLFGFFKLFLTVIVNNIPTTCIC